MGSVGKYYKCPLCGRVGNGGYALDGVSESIGPICTGGPWSCLWQDMLDVSFIDAIDRHAKAFQAVIVQNGARTSPVQNIDPLVTRNICSFLFVNTDKELWRLYKAMAESNE